MRFYYCGTPEYACMGRLSKTDHIGLKGTMLKVHASPTDSFACHVAYLLSQGFVRVSRREYINPTDGSVRVLSKPSRFGLACRWGKENNRIQPVRNNGPWIIDRP